ncbi:hypothetical protein A3731_19565 [Roseovarius sp. HI0049]|nr:hypothetical protein A3731_19565 [Roseovarius sp. HI0049]
MERIGCIAAVAAGLALAGCGGAPMETATRNAPADFATPQMAQVAPLAAAVKVTSVKVRVPRTLQVSEANRFYPGGDIVWREDPPGDRHAQVQKIVEAAMLKGVRAVEGEGRPVVLDIEVTRFHALTEKTRRTVGAVHALQFTMQYRDPETGAALSAPKFVKADFKGFGGKAAKEAERAGQTQKVRITDHLAGVIRQQLTDPAQYQSAKLGLMSAFD